MRQPLTFGDAAGTAMRPASDSSSPPSTTLVTEALRPICAAAAPIEPKAMKP
jgi:hypothetical protein